MKRLFILVTILLSGGILSAQFDFFIRHGTTIVVFVKKDSIWLATDSRSLPSWNMVRTKPDTICKIQEHNSIYFACAGIPQISSTHFRFKWDVYETIKKE